jgi:polysaccharide pyruvyl transferase WcaK-like protein
MGKRGKAARAVTAIYGVLGCRHVLLGGGSVLNQLQGVRRLQSTLGRFRRTRWSAVGVSVGPFHSKKDEREVQEFIARFHGISVRDGRSLVDAKRLGAGAVSSNGGDLALQKETRVAAGTNHRLVFIPCIGVDEKLQWRFARAIGESVIHLDSIPEIVVLSVNSNTAHGDDELSRRCADLLEALGAKYLRYVDLGVEETWDLIGSSSWVISGRLHGAITAYRHSVPFVALEYHPKVSDFLDDVHADKDLRVKQDADQDAVAVVLKRLLSQRIESQEPS